MKLKLECVIEDVDGNTFSVGRNCAEKTNDYTLTSSLKDEIAKVEHEAFEREVNLFKSDLSDAQFASKVKDLSHPTPFFAKNGQSLFDYWEFIQEGAGLKKQAEVARQIRRRVLRDSEA